jgi:hypothetical protein
MIKVSKELENDYLWETTPDLDKLLALGCSHPPRSDGKNPQVLARSRSFGLEEKQSSETFKQNFLKQKAVEDPDDVLFVLNNTCTWTAQGGTQN